MEHKISKGTQCELCGMLAELVQRGAEGAVHYYCAHHKPRRGGSDQVTAARDLVTSGHGKHAGHTTNMFKTRFWVCLALTLLILADAEIVQKVLGLKVPDFHGREILILGLASVIFCYGGWVFIKGALAEIKQRLPGMRRG